MKPGTADFRRANDNPSYKCIQRHDYEVRAHEFCKRGVDLPQSKLTEDDVRDIRKNVKGLTDKQQAEKYNMSSVSIYKIRKYERWSHIQ